jgi:hypothetical protein
MILIDANLLLYAYHPRADPCELIHTPRPFLPLHDT